MCNRVKICPHTQIVTRNSDESSQCGCKAMTCPDVCGTYKKPRLTSNVFTCQLIFTLCVTTQYCTSYTMATRFFETDIANPDEQHGPVYSLRNRATERQDMIRRVAAHRAQERPEEPKLYKELAEDQNTMRRVEAQAAQEQPESPRFHEQLAQDQDAMRSKEHHGHKVEHVQSRTGRGGKKKRERWAILL
jgi:hypothetical protein